MCTGLVRLFATTARQLIKKSFSFLTSIAASRREERERSRFTCLPALQLAKVAKAPPLSRFPYLPSCLANARKRQPPHHGPRSGEEQGTARERTLRHFSMPHLACPMCTHPRFLRVSSVCHPAMAVCACLRGTSVTTSSRVQFLVRRAKSSLDDPAKVRAKRISSEILSQNVGS